MKIKSLEELIKYIQNNNLTEAQESYIRSTIAWDQDRYDEVKNEPN
jgi:hypothetical protein